MTCTDDDFARFEHNMIFGKLTAFGAVLKMLAASGFAKLTPEQEGAWIADLNRYVARVHPPAGLNQSEMDGWLQVKGEAKATAARIMTEASELAATYRAAQPQGASSVGASKNSAADLFRVMGRMTAQDAIVRMIAGNAFAGQAEEHAQEWAAEVLRYLGTLEPEPDLAPDELLAWVAVKAEATASGARLLKDALDIAARIRADRDQD